MDQCENYYFFYNWLGAFSTKSPPRSATGCSWIHTCKAPHYILFIAVYYLLALKFYRAQGGMGYPLVEKFPRILKLDIKITSFVLDYNIFLIVILDEVLLLLAWEFTTGRCSLLPLKSTYCALVSHGTQPIDRDRYSGK